MATLVALRERHSLGQEDAARKIGIGLRQYQRWEAGESMPRATNLGRAALAYGVPPSVFYDEEELPVPSVPQLDRIEETVRALDDRVARIAPPATYADLARIPAQQQALAEAVAKLADEVAAIRRLLKSRDRKAQDEAHAKESELPDEPLDDEDQDDRHKQP